MLAAKVFQKQTTGPLGRRACLLQKDNESSLVTLDCYC